MSLFKTIECEEKQSSLDELWYLKFLGQRYSEALKKYFNINIWCPMNSTRIKDTEEQAKKRLKKYNRQIGQLKKLCNIIQELQVEPVQYIKAHFEMLTPWVKKTSGISYVTLSMLTSDNAKDRWFKWLDRIDNQNELKKDKIAVQYADTLTDNTRQVIFRSIKNFYKIVNWYLEKDELHNFNPLHLLEICHKAGDVDSMYVYINPMVNAECGNKYLEQIWKAQDKKLNKKYKDWLQRLFEETRPVVEENGVEKYV